MEGNTLKRFEHDFGAVENIKRKKLWSQYLTRFIVPEDAARHVYARFDVDNIVFKLCLANPVAQIQLESDDLGRDQSVRRVHVTNALSVESVRLDKAPPYIVLKKARLGAVWLFEQELAMASYESVSQDIWRERYKKIDKWFEQAFPDGVVRPFQ